jgi:hypothetical protein
MIGVQFVKVGGADMDLSSVAQLDNSFQGFDEEGFFATELKVWNGVNGYDNYGWSGTSATEYLEDSTRDNSWLTADLDVPLEKAKAGSGFWIVAANAGTITLAGEVPSEASVTMDLGNGFNMVANPYPGTVPVSTFGMLDDKFPGFDEEGFFKVEMKIWNGVNGYDNYGWSGTSASEYLEDPTRDNMWLTADLDVPDATKTVSYGTAVWITTEQTGTITFTAPTAE